MAGDRDCSESLRTAVLDAAGESRPLQLLGHGSKAFYGRENVGDPLSLAEHSGIISYEPTELVITARGGTPLKEIEDALREKGQMLPFEPPQFDGKGTIGGAIASGLSGPRRPWGGAPRDLLLGMKLLDGRGQILRFGGQVMKNVAGYDLSRLMAGAMGTLGVLLEVSIKVLPKPPQEHTLMLSAGDCSVTWPLLHKMLIEGIPVTASYSQGEQHKLRVACSPQRVKQIVQRYAVEAVDDQDAFWRALRDQQLDYFKQKDPLWRLSIPPAANIDDEEQILCEWSGGLRWLFSQRPGSEIRTLVEKVGGHAILFRNGDRSGEIFHPLHPRLADLQIGLKQVFDPEGIFNPGRHYPDY
ncbi:MAG: glycolate oxidase subunit GlcE [Candidatus Thiodiazotropha sp. (ex Ctena orbiculata)]|uniref:Glycolate oxidase subunit GlcE n=1 Tax=Candidatus Thiodiazotropha taylori TaxID=2792791 RepID=A0A944MD20_9GAMM|nr:glycolate oxidase subunit GlcE [Candidatus Thiodiazotropha taylori]MBV2137184.1 glycolate oxidase subunit GlcE [Candidatus Thiodiazotropha taylori]